MMYKLIAIDLDGTLLNSQKEISKTNIKQIEYAINKGIRVVICSGRIFAGARIFARQLNIKEPLIACNGAIIKDMKTEETLYDNPMSLEDCQRVIKICHDFGIYFHIYIGDTMYTERLEFSSLTFWKKNEKLSEKDRMDIKLIEDMSATVENIKKQASKIVVISNNMEELLCARERVSLIKTVDVVSSNFDNFEVMNKGVNKGYALKYISEKLGIKREEVISIGDNENDYSMLNFAGLGVAMGNAEPEAKKIADFVTLSNDEDGVAEVIKKFVL